MKLLIGLGNPDSDYGSTRHNLGHLVIASFLQSQSLPLKSYPKLSAKLAEINGTLVGTVDCFMNESGIPIQKILHYFKIDPADLYIIHDDLDLRVGEWKLQFDRGSAGHNGIKSIIDQIGTQSFWRYRVGIDHPPAAIPVENYVLQSFLPAEKVIIDQTIDKIINTILGH